MRFTSSGSNLTAVEVVEALTTDTFGRAGDVAGFVSILGGSSVPRSVAVDARWGQGKTVFCRQTELVLRHLNPQCDTFADSAVRPDEGERLDVALEEWCSTQLKEAMPTSVLPVYYNAWDFEHWGDPAPSLGAAIASAGDSGFSPEGDRHLAGPVAKGLAKLMAHAQPAMDALVPGFGFSVRLASEVGAELAGATAAESLVGAYQKREALRAQVGFLVDEVLKERGNRMLLIIDELDRCDPAHALRLLREVRRLFESDRLTVLYAVNGLELSRSLQGVYGPAFHGAEYLDRFFDMKLGLTLVHPRVTAREFSRGRPYDGPLCRPLGDLNMTVRQAGQYLAEIEAKSGRIGEPISLHPERPSSLMVSWLAPLLIGLKHVDPVAYHAVMAERNVEALDFHIQPSIIDDVDRLMLSEYADPTGCDEGASGLDMLHALVEHLVYRGDSRSRCYDFLAKRLNGREFDDLRPKYWYDVIAG